MSGSGVERPKLTFEREAAEAIVEAMGWYVDNTGTIRRENGDTPKSIHGNAVAEEDLAGVITVDGEPVPVTDDFDEVVEVVKKRCEASATESTGVEQSGGDGQ